MLQETLQIDISKPVATVRGHRGREGKFSRLSTVAITLWNSNGKRWLSESPPALARLSPLVNFSI